MFKVNVPRKEISGTYYFYLKGKNYISSLISLSEKLRLSWSLVAITVVSTISTKKHYRLFKTNKYIYKIIIVTKNINKY